jgi:hypothetical protein
MLRDDDVALARSHGLEALREDEPEGQRIHCSKPYVWNVFPALGNSQLSCVAVRGLK